LSLFNTFRQLHAREIAFFNEHTCLLDLSKPIYPIYMPHKYCLLLNVSSLKYSYFLSLPPSPPFTPTGPAHSDILDLTSSAVAQPLECDPSTQVPRLIPILTTDCSMTQKRAVVSYFEAEDWNRACLYVTAGFRRGVNDLPTFRENVSVPSSKIRQSCFKFGPFTCPETSVNNCQSTLRNNSEERRSRLSIRQYT
jgi:hypothetical protein